LNFYQLQSTLQGELGDLVMSKGTIQVLTAAQSNPFRKKFINDAEIESIYGIRRKTLQNWRILGRGPSWRKFGKSVVYSVDALERWIEAQPTGGEGVPSSEARRTR
jgi:hypothetical protein